MKGIRSQTADSLSAASATAAAAASAAAGSTVGINSSSISAAAAEGANQERRHSDHCAYRRSAHHHPHHSHRYVGAALHMPRIRIVKANFDENATHRQEPHSGLVLQHLPHQRRESFLYKSDSDFDVSPKTSRHSSIASELHSDEIIVTPFAQVLHTLRSVHDGVKALTGAVGSSSKQQQQQQQQQQQPSRHRQSSKPGASGSEADEADYSTLANKTLNDLEWCLEQLETIQTHRSVADMASSKFKKLLDLELERMSSLPSNASSANQIENYIKSTFLEKDEDSSEDRGRSARDANGAQATMTQVKLTPSSEGGDAASTKSLPAVPNYGVETPHGEELQQLFDSSLSEWGFDIFSADLLSCQRPLTSVAFAIFERRDFFNKFRIDEATLVKYFGRIESHYKRDNPYHNAVHAADVTQSIHVLFSAPSLNNVFSDLDVFASLFACAIHDVNHPGVTNQFLINTESELAIMYNDMSVLENHHCAVAFKLLQEPGCNILREVDESQRKQLRKMVIDMVLATDMSKHMSLLADLKTMVETKKVAGGCLLKLDNYSEKIQILQNMVHCADLSNPAKPLHISTQWVSRLMDEFFSQGDREKALGLPVSPMCCRETANVEKSQVSFIDFIMHPLWEAWTELVHPDAEHILCILEQNRDHYCELLAVKENEAEQQQQQQQQQPLEEEQPAA